MQTQIAHQLGRRNLHPDQASYLRGKRYNGEKQTQGGTGANQHAQSSQNDNSAKTHERLATEYHVSPATITRDGQYAERRNVLPTNRGNHAPCSDPVATHQQSWKTTNTHLVD